MDSSTFLVKPHLINQSDYVDTSICTSVSLLTANEGQELVSQCANTLTHDADIQHQQSTVGFNPSTSSSDHIMCQTCHRLVEHTRSSELYPCLDCKSTFILPDNLIVHRLLNHQSVLDQSNSYSCPLCQKYFHRFAAFKSHLLFHQVDEDLLCPECHQLVDRDPYPRAQSPLRNSGQGQEMQYRCSICGMMLSSVGKVKQHYKRRHPMVRSKSRPTSLLARVQSSSPEAVETGVRCSKARALTDLTKLIKPNARKPRTLDSIYDSLIKELGPEQLPMSDTQNDPASSKRSKRPSSHVCSFCRKKFPKPCLLKRHMTIHTKEKPFMCMLCESRFTQKSSAKSHLALHFKSKPPAAAAIKSGTVKPTQSAPIPYLQVLPPMNQPIVLNVRYTNANLPSQLVRTTPSSMNMAFCTKPLAMVDQPGPTKLVLSEDQQSFSCSLCTANFSSSQAFSVHMRHHLAKSDETTNPYYLVSLPESFLQSDSRITIIQNPNFRHLPDGSPVKKGSYKCPKCSLNLQSERKLRFHTLYQCDKSVFTCLKCARRFVTHTGLEKHYLTRHRTLKRSTKCSICSVSFPSISMLARHINVHSNERLFSCYVCHKRFKFLSTCRKHIRTHSTSETDTWDQAVGEVQSSRKSKTAKIRVRHPPSGIHSDAKPVDSMSPIVVELDRNPWPQTISPSNLIEPHQDQFENSCQPDENPNPPPVIILPEDKICHLQGVPIYVIDPELPDSFVTYTDRAIVLDKDLQSVAVGTEASMQHHQQQPCFLVNPPNPSPSQVWNAGADFLSNAEPFIQTIPSSGLGQPNITALANSDILSTYHDLILPDSFDPESHQCSVDPDAFYTVASVTKHHHDETINTCEETLGIIQDKFPSDDNPESRVKHRSDDLYPITDQAKQTRVQSGKESQKFGINVNFYGCGRCKQNYPSAEHLQAHYHTSHSYLPKPFKCKQCPRAFTSETLLKTHARCHDPNAKDDLTCPCCPGQDFTNRSALTRHILYCHPLPIPEPFQCTQCGSGFRMLRSLKTHVKTMLDGLGNCKSTVPQDGDPLDEGLMYDHATEPRHSLSSVPLMLDSSLVNQIAKLQPSDKLTLSEKYLIKAATEKVDRIVTLPKAFTPTPNPKFPSNQSKYIRSCPKCGRKFSRPSGLRSHMLIHLPARHKCDLCDDSFKKPSQLRQHKQIVHESQLKFNVGSCKPKLLCHLCGLSCASKSSLRMHVRLHTGTRRYQCPHCLTLFHNPNHRRRHLAKCSASSWYPNSRSIQSKVLSQSVPKAYLFAAREDNERPETQQQQPEGEKQHSFVEQLKQPLQDDVDLDRLEDVHPVTTTTIINCLESESQFAPSSHRKQPQADTEKDIDSNYDFDASSSDYDLDPKLSNRVKTTASFSRDDLPLTPAPPPLPSKTDSYLSLDQVPITSDLFQPLLQCTICSQIFASQTLFNSHTCFPVPSPTIAADSSQTKVSLKPKKNKKRRSNTNDSYASSSLQRIFKCSTCQKTFGKRSILARHELTHRQIKPHVCDMCGRGFTQSFSLVTHQLIHRNERPFQCPQCSAAFRQRSNLMRHVRLIHSTEDS